MFSSRKAVAPAFDNTDQTASFEEEVELGMVQRAEPPLTPSSFLPQPQIARSLKDPDVMVQAELAKQYANQYANEVSASKANSPAAAEDPDAARLCIGSKIKMKGSVEDCGVLQVDGHFEASAQSKELKITQSGTFVGDADVHSAEIVGRFDGNISVKDKLLIRSTGVVTGTVRYGSIEIESGGRISGDIQAILRNEPPAKMASPEVSASPVQSEPSPEPSPPRLNFSDGPRNPADTVAASNTVAPSNMVAPSQPAAPGA